LKDETLELCILAKVISTSLNLIATFLCSNIGTNVCYAVARMKSQVEAKESNSARTKSTLSLPL